MRRRVDLFPRRKPAGLWLALALVVWALWMSRSVGSLRAQLRALHKETRGVPTAVVKALWAEQEAADRRQAAWAKRIGLPPFAELRK